MAIKNGCHRRQFFHCGMGVPGRYLVPLRMSHCGTDILDLPEPDMFKG